MERDGGYAGSISIWELGVEVERGKLDPVYANGARPGRQAPGRGGLDLPRASPSEELRPLSRGGGQRQ